MAIEATMDWQQQVADRLMSPADAMRIVKSGDVVWMGALSSVPVTLCQALIERADELADVTICTCLTPVDWDRSELTHTFTIRTIYTGPLERKAAQEGRFDYVPVARSAKGACRRGGTSSTTWLPSRSRRRTRMAIALSAVPSSSPPH